MNPTYPKSPQCPINPHYVNSRHIPLPNRPKRVLGPWGALQPHSRSPEHPETSNFGILRFHTPYFTSFSHLPGTPTPANSTHQTRSKATRCGKSGDDCRQSNQGDQISASAAPSKLKYGVNHEPQTHPEIDHRRQGIPGPIQARRNASPSRRHDRKSTKGFRGGRGMQPADQPAAPDETRAGDHPTAPGREITARSRKGEKWQSGATSTT